MFTFFLISKAPIWSFTSHQILKKNGIPQDLKIKVSPGFQLAHQLLFSFRLQSHWSKSSLFKP